MENIKMATGSSASGCFTFPDSRNRERISSTKATVLDLFSAGRDPDWRNRLIWGTRIFLPSLLDELPAKQI